MDATAEARVVRLRRIAAVEIARHREALGFVGVALEGSVATGAVWPTSDVDFTVVPRPEHSRERLIEWEGREAHPFPKAETRPETRIDVCGEREGIPWHKHLTDARALQALIETYPASFICTAEGPFDSVAHGFLDGLAVMEVVEDSEGLLGETREFVAARRFAADVWEGRRHALLAELRRRGSQAHEAIERGEADAVYPILGGQSGFAAVAAQLWLESANKIVSGKEQDGQLAGVANAAGCPEVHALYRCVLAVDPLRARAAAPLLVRLSRRGPRLYRRLGALAPEEHGRETAVWGAHIAHLAGTLGLAPLRGHPAHVYQSLEALRHWAVDYPARLTASLAERDAAVGEALQWRVAEVAALAERVHALLFDPARADDSARRCLAAADRLLELTETRL